MEPLPAQPHDQGTETNAVTRIAGIRRSRRRSISRRKALVLILVLVSLLGCILRGYSLSHYPGQAEAGLITQALQMGKAGSLTPPDSGEGPLVHYCLLGVTLAGRALGLVPPVGEILEGWQTTPPGESSTGLTLARLTGLLLGLATLVGAVLAGFFCGGLPGALTAGLALAAAPLAVRQGRLLTPELASMAMVATGLWLAIWAVRSVQVLAAVAAAFFFGLSFGGRAYGLLLVIPLTLIYMDLVPQVQLRFRRGLTICLACGVGLLLGATGRILDFGWWVEFIRGHLAGPQSPIYGLEGEAAGWVFLLTRTLPWSLAFPLLSLTGMVGLFFGMRSGRYEWRFLFWSFAILFVLIGGVQDRSARAALPLVVLMAVGAGLFVASFWLKLKRHPGAAVLTLIVALMLGLSLPSLFLEARVMARPDSRHEALAFLEQVARTEGRLEVAAMLPIRSGPPGGTDSPRRCRDGYPELSRHRFRTSSLCALGHQPILDHNLWSQLSKARGAGDLPWDYYIWSSWADGVMEERGRAYYSGALDAFAHLSRLGRLVATFGDPEEEDPQLRTEAAHRVVANLWSRSPGPTIRIYRLRPAGKKP